jgi:hypothetical protein
MARSKVKNNYEKENKISSPCQNKAYSGREYLKSKFKANINRILSSSKKTHYLREGYTAAVDLFKKEVKYDFLICM